MLDLYFAHGTHGLAALYNTVYAKRDLKIFNVHTVVGSNIVEMTGC